MSSTSMRIPHNNAPSNEAESPHRPQADPLPSKRGEIGYIEVVAAESPAERSQVTTSNTHVLPARHPADRDHSPISSDAVIPPAQSEDVTHPRSESSPCTASIIKSHGILDIFKPERSPAFGGLRLTTLLIFVAQTTLLGGTVTAWVFKFLMDRYNGFLQGPPSNRRAKIRLSYWCMMKFLWIPVDSKN